LIAENVYDELGVLTTKKVGNTSATPLQNVNYWYNIRGWLISINNLVPFHPESDNGIFNYHINYNGTFNGDTSKPLYNGNIASIAWRTKTDNITRGYGYDYDHLNRLNYASNLKALGGASFFVNLGRDGQYAEDLSYDKNGNITTLKRYGQEELGQPIEIDDLTYTYTANQLQTVTDATNNPEGFNDGNTVGNDYVYDTFGNITQDKNKKITNVKYNHLNLPTEVVFNTGKINYIYDAAGTRLSKKVQPSGGALVTTDYVNGFQYENNVLQFFPHPEGYVKRNENNTYLYVYQYKDHLGNVRLSYADVNKNGTIEPASEILEENNYYPFGLLHKGYNNIANSNRSEAAEKYKYNGKEYEDALGLNMYEYGVRNYDAAVGRFFNIDRLTEKYESISPYNYTANNPVRFIDVDGEWIDIYDSDGTQFRYMEGGSVQKYDKKNKEWLDVEDKSSLSSYVQDVIANLYKLEVSGPTGSAVIGYFNDDSRQVDFRGYDTRTHSTFSSLYNNIFIQEGFAVNFIMTVDGRKKTSMFLTIGHELAHVIDRYENPKHYQDVWVFDSDGNPISRSEIFASHIENQIRAESGYPLRKYYGMSALEDGRHRGLKRTLLLDRDNNSLYFRQTAPSIFDIQNRGEIISQKIKQIKIKDGRYNYN